MNEHFHVDLADPEDVQAKLPEIKALLDERRKALKALEQQVELLRRLVGEGVPKPKADGTGSTSRSRGGKPKRSPRAGLNAPSQDRAVAALEQAGMAMAPKSLHQYMLANGLEAPKDANVLGSNLWSAWKAGKIMKASNGVYQPLDGTGRTTIDHPITDYYFAHQPGNPLGPPLNGGAPVEQ